MTYKECEYAQEERLTERVRQAGIPGRYVTKNFGDYKETAANRDATAIVHWYIEEKPLCWLYITGGCGTGKTFLVSLLAKGLMRTEQVVIFRDFQSILDELKSSFDEKAETASAVLRKYQTCEVLILDDVGTGYFRDWGVSVLHQLINYRYNENLRTVITSNYDLADLKERLGSQEKYAAARIISRLEEESEVVYMGEEDWRGAK